MEGRGRERGRGREGRKRGEENGYEEGVDLACPTFSLVHTTPLYQG